MSGKKTKKRKSRTATPDALLRQSLSRHEHWVRILGKAVETSNDGVLLTDPSLPDNPIVYASDEFVRLTRYPREQIIGRNCRFLQGRNSDREQVRQIGEAVRSGQPFSGKLLNYRRDGSEFVNHLRIIPLLDDTGKLTHFVGIQNDVSRRDAERRANQRLETFFRFASEFFAEYDVANSHINWVGDVDAKTGYGRGEFPRRWNHFLEILHPDDVELVKLVFQTSTQAGQEQITQCRVRQRDGSYAHWVLRGLPVEVAKDQVQKWMIVCEDVSREAYARSRIRHLSRGVLTVQDDERRRIARELHDDVSQRLVALAMGLQRIAQTDGESPVDLSLDAMAQMASDLAADVHHIARILHPTVLEDLGIEAVIRGELERFETREGIEARLITQFRTDVRDLEIELTYLRVLQEALRNISKHSKASHVVVTLSHDGRKFRLAITDDGIGFNADQRSAASGIGLIGMHERVDLIGGQLRIDSSPGAGTTIEIVTIPSHKWSLT